MAKQDQSEQKPSTTTETKKRVSNAFDRWRKSFGDGIVGCTSAPRKLTPEMKADIEAGRPVLNQY